VYVKNGEGQGNVLMWGLSPYDNNGQINAYKEEFGVTNPCAGTQGGAPAAIQTVIDGQQFYGYPTYCVVCPDKKLHFNVCFPPSVECFDAVVAGCTPSAIGDDVEVDRLVKIYPNPANNYTNIELDLDGEAKIEIINLLGSVVYQRQVQSISGETNVVPLFVGNLPDGLYLLSVKTDIGHITKKLTIKR
jgi:hypothetical protein